MDALLRLSLDIHGPHIPAQGILHNPASPSAFFLARLRLTEPESVYHETLRRAIPFPKKAPVDPRDCMHPAAFLSPASFLPRSASAHPTEERFRFHHPSRDRGGFPVLPDPLFFSAPYFAEKDVLMRTVPHKPETSRNSLRFSGRAVS